MESRRINKYYLIHLQWYKYLLRDQKNHKQLYQLDSYCQHLEIYGNVDM